MSEGETVYVYNQMLSGSWRDLRAVGMRRTGREEAGLCEIRLPPGWRVVRSPHSGCHFLDEKGRCRGYMGEGKSRVERFIVMKRRYECIRWICPNGKAGRVLVQDSLTGEVLYKSKPVQFSASSSSSLSRRAFEQAMALQPACDEAEEWLKQRYPKWNNPRAYWD